MADARLRLVQGQIVPAGLPVDPLVFQSECVDAFVASWAARGFAASTIDNDIGVLDRMLEALGRPAWEVTAEDVDRVVGDLARAGRATSTRRNYLQVFKGFHRFLEVRKAVEIEAAFGVRLVCPVDEYNSARHVSSDCPAQDPPPTPERVLEFFGFLRARIGTARKYAPAARDYALFRTLYHAGIRCEEAVLLDVPDVHFSRGPFGKLHVRFGKAARTSGPRPRWVPMLDGLDLQLRWFLDDIRGRFPDSAVLFCDESGGQLATGTVRNRLRHLMKLEGLRRRLVHPAFAAPGLRHSQLRARHGPGRDPADARALDGGFDDAVRPALRNVHRGRLPAGGLGRSERTDRRRVSMQIRWKLRIAAAQREVWTGSQLRRLLAERAGLEMSSASVSALFTRQPSQLKLTTLLALCTALQCTPDDLFDLDTTPVERPAASAPAALAVTEPGAAPGRSMPPI